MEKVWFRELGFHSNPFSIKPAAFTDDVLGFDSIVDEISYGVLNGKVVLLDGDYGNGKSTILKKILNDFGGKKQVIYYSCNRKEGTLDVKALLNGRYGFFGELFDIKPKDMILLLDEAQELSSKDFERIYPYYQEGYLKSIVIVGKDIKKENVTGGMKSGVTEVIIGKLNEDLAVKIIRKRIGDLPLLSDSVVRKIYQKTGDNVRVLLKTCEDVCKTAVESGRKKVTEEYLKTYFSDKEEVKEEKIVEEKVVHEKKPVVIDKREEKVVEEKKKVVEEKKPIVVDKKEEKAVHHDKKDDKKNPPKGRVYRPEEYGEYSKKSAEDLLNKPTDEIFGDEQYY